MRKRLHPGDAAAVFLDAGVEALVGGGVARDVVRRVDVELDAALLEDFGHGADRHPDGGHEGDRRKRADLVEFLFHLHGSVLQRAARIHHVVGDLEEVLAAGVAGHLVARLAGRAEDDDLHAQSLSLEGHVDVDGVDAGVRTLLDEPLDSSKGGVDGNDSGV